MKLQMFLQVFFLFFLWYADKYFLQYHEAQVGSSICKVEAVYNHTLSPSAGYTKEQ